MEQAYNDLGLGRYVFTGLPVTIPDRPPSTLGAAVSEASSAHGSAAIARAGEAHTHRTSHSVAASRTTAPPQPSSLAPTTTPAVSQAGPDNLDPSRRASGRRTPVAHSLPGQAMGTLVEEHVGAGSEATARTQTGTNPPRHRQANTTHGDAAEGEGESDSDDEGGQGIDTHPACFLSPWLHILCRCAASLC